MLDETTPFTYLIGWSKLDKWYYGVKFAEGCHPDDLWVTYFTSSKVVPDMREKHGEPDIIQIRRTFTSVQSAINWETKVLKRIEVLYNDRWLNQSAFPAMEWSPERREKRSKSMMGEKGPNWKGGITAAKADIKKKNAIFKKVYKEISMFRHYEGFDMSVAFMNEPYVSHIIDYIQECEHLRNVEKTNRLIADGYEGRQGKPQAYILG
tara:strand:+ start:125 stop:748 length:624 start_codon:yes stop_codon:yes gene_type:complete